MMSEVEVSVYPILHWYVCVNIAQETDKTCIQQQISMSSEREQYPKCRLKHPFVNCWASEEGIATPVQQVVSALKLWHSGKHFQWLTENLHNC